MTLNMLCKCSPTDLLGFETVFVAHADPELVILPGGWGYKYVLPDSLGDIQSNLSIPTQAAVENTVDLWK